MHRQTPDLMPAANNMPFKFKHCLQDAPPRRSYTSACTPNSSTIPPASTDLCTISAFSYAAVLGINVGRFVLLAATRASQRGCQATPVPAAAAAHTPASLLLCCSRRHEPGEPPHPHPPLPPTNQQQARSLLLLLLRQRACQHLPSHHAPEIKAAGSITHCSA